MNAKQICGVIVALSVATVAARADSLEWKNGSLIKGKFMSGTQTSISFQVGSTVQNYDIADVRSLRFDFEPCRESFGPRSRQSRMTLPVLPVRMTANACSCSRQEK